MQYIHTSDLKDKEDLQTLFRNFLLWENEKLSLVNTIGRIPVVGMAFDIFAGFLVD